MGVWGRLVCLTTELIPPTPKTHLTVHVNNRVSHHSSPRFYTTFLDERLNPELTGP